MFLDLEFCTERIIIFNSLFLCSYESVRPHYIIIIIVVVVIIITTELSLGGSSPYTSTDRTIRIKYT